MSTAYDWTTIGTTILPVQHRAQFLAHLRGEHTVQGGEPEPVEWIEPTSRQHPVSHAETIMAAVRTFEIHPVVEVAYNLTWLADQHTRKPGPGPDSERYPIVGIRSRKQSMYFIARGMTITPVLIEVPDKPYVEDPPESVPVDTESEDA